MSSVRDKVTVVTGAGSGIGRRLALELARRGARLAISDVNESGLNETADLAKALGAEVHTARLDVVFAGRFLDALRPGPAPAPACWRPLLRLRAHPGIRAVQFALAGINAHIEHDLPLAVVDTCRQLGCAPAELCGDFHRVNDVLAQVEQRVRARLLPSLAGLERELDIGDPLLHLLSSWSVDRARDAAWAGALTLWELRDNPAVFAGAARALDDACGLVSHCLLTPLGGTPRGDAPRGDAPRSGTNRGGDPGRA